MVESHLNKEVISFFEGQKPGCLKTNLFFLNKEVIQDDQQK